MTIETQDLTRQICDLKDEPLIKDMREDVKVVFRPVMTATERAKRYIEAIESPHAEVVPPALPIIRGLLAECERLKEELADLKHADEIGYCRFELGKKLGIKTVETDCRVMTEAVVDAHKRTGETESYHPCTCPACVAAKKYLGGENE
jgi:hypothetical protein